MGPTREYLDASFSGLIATALHSPRQYGWSGVSGASYPGRQLGNTFIKHQAELIPRRWQDWSTDQVCAQGLSGVPPPSCKGGLGLHLFTRLRTCIWGFFPI